ncbi:GCN5-related N-acetyltransferase [Formosa agariphila KMM 3901]|uniref:GCN5-related N-acetyltransferase n=1 Tax=Formosa agariphila (strain DSM 15362 / KCTC 12365 / LMG 23005 / KMM 3901 / M-2Alg 35-1) TaxID=1347342 RepID=T2KHG7_FORAG|nr:GNAT family N-acetyltransferase [Formosa agariphila]CDF77851.1 GCN5-related N-acetyltransferase [Formosa agariphila KMM 3901]
MYISATKRLYFEELNTSDAPFILELMNTPHWLEHIGDRNIKTLEDAKNVITNTHLKSYREHGFGFYKLLLKSENLSPIGVCGLIKRPELDGVDIGFAFLPAYERQGLGSESALEIIKLAETKFNLKEVLAIVSPENSASIKLLEKLGLTYQKNVTPFSDGKELLLFSKTLKP